MGVGPAYAIPVAVRNAGLTLKDIDVFEINEVSSAVYQFVCPPVCVIVVLDGHQFTLNFVLLYISIFTLLHSTIHNISHYLVSLCPCPLSILSSASSFFDSPSLLLFSFPLPLNSNPQNPYPSTPPNNPSSSTPPKSAPRYRESPLSPPGFCVSMLVLCAPFGHSN